MSIAAYGVGPTFGRPEYFQYRVQKAYEAAEASNREIVAAAEAAGITPHADFSRVSHAQLAAHIGAADGVIYTTDLRQIADFATADAGKRLDALFEARDLSGLASGTTFTAKPEGGLRIDHPRAAEIEAALDADPTLKNDILSAIALQEDAARAEAASLYATAYERTFKQSGAAAAGELAVRFQALSGPSASLRYGKGGLSTLINGGGLGNYLQGVASAFGLEAGARVNVRA